MRRKPGKPIDKNFYRKGDANAISDDSGQKFKRSEMRKTWDGLIVHKSEWYSKHPQLNLRPRREKAPFRNTRPRPGSETEQGELSYYLTSENDFLYATNKGLLYLLK